MVRLGGLTSKSEIPLRALIPSINFVQPIAFIHFI